MHAVSGNKHSTQHHMVRNARYVFYIYIKLIDSGKVFKTFATGDGKLNDSMAELKYWVDEYRFILSNIHLRVTNTLVVKVDKGRPLILSE